MGVAKNTRGANMPSGLDTENVSVAIVPPPSARQTDVATTIFLFAAARSSIRPPRALSPVPNEDSFVVIVPRTAELRCWVDVLMVRSRDVPHLKTTSSTTTHMHTKATQATLVAACGRLATDRIVPIKAPMHTTQRITCCPTGRSSAFDIAMISGVSCISRGSFLRAYTQVGMELVGSGEDVRETLGVHMQTP